MADQRKKVLIMDDNKLIIDTVKRILDLLKYDCEYALNGEEMLELFSKRQQEKSPFDLVIMDLTIPEGMGAKDAIIQLKKLNPEIKAIITSGNPLDETMQNYTKYGFDGILEKPFSIDKIKTTIEILLNN